MCRQPEVRYLWIDSLCIIQSGDESMADWEEHVSLMGQIYSNSDVCIATAAAAGATECSLKRRDPRMIEPVIHSKGGSTSVVLALNHAFSGHRSSKLASCGWVLQERLLSPRVLTIGPRQLFWECETTEGRNICENFPSGLPLDVLQHSCPRNLTMSLRQQGPFSPIRSPSLPRVDPLRDALALTPDDRMLMVWKDLADMYSECQLTRAAEDKFAAFAGLARYFSTYKSKQSPYIAGFFLYELPQALLWSVKGRAPQSRPSDLASVYRSPSWSWAATDAPFKTERKTLDWRLGFSDISVQLHATVIDHIRKLSRSTDPFGPLQYADLIIKANPIPVTWTPSKPVQWIWKRPRVLQWKGDLIQHKATFKIGQFNMVEHICIQFDSIDDYNDEGPACFIPIRSWPIYLKDNPKYSLDSIMGNLMGNLKYLTGLQQFPLKEDRIEGLVVRPADPSVHRGAEEKLFCKRIGVARLISETFLDALSHVAELRIVLL